MGSVAIQNDSKHCGLLVSVRVNVSSWGPLTFKLKGREMIQWCSHQGAALLRVVLWGYWGTLRTTHHSLLHGIPQQLVLSY